MNWVEARGFVGRGVLGRLFNEGREEARREVERRARMVKVQGFCVVLCGWGGGMVVLSRESRRGRGDLPASCCSWATAGVHWM